MGPFPSSESSLISYLLREGDMMLKKKAMQAVESKPRILSEREWKSWLRLQAPARSVLGIRVLEQLPTFLFLSTSWFTLAGLSWMGPFPTSSWQFFTMLVHDPRHSLWRQSLVRNAWPFFPPDKTLSRRNAFNIWLRYSFHRWNAYFSQEGLISQEIV